MVLPCWRTLTIDDRDDHKCPDHCPAPHRRVGRRARSSSSRARAPARRASSSNAFAGCSRRKARRPSTPVATCCRRSRRPTDDPFDGPLLPEQILVLTYNVKAAKELQRPPRAGRRRRRAGPPDRQQLPQLLPSRPDRVGRRRRPAGAARRARRHRPVPAAARPPAGPAARSTTLAAATPTTGSTSSSHSSTARRTSSSRQTNSTPSSTREREAFESATAATRRALERLEAQGNLGRCARCAKRVRRLPTQRARRGGRRRVADVRPRGRRQDGRPRSPTDDRAATAGRVIASEFHRPTSPRIDALADTYVATAPPSRSSACRELALVYRAYQDELARRGALDFGEQIAAVDAALQAPPERPPPLPAPVPLRPRRRVPGREHRADRADRAARSDARPARQRHGRRRRRPVDLPLPRRELRRVRRVRPPLLAAPPPHDPDGHAPGPPPRLRSRRTSARSDQS